MTSKVRVIIQGVDKFTATVGKSLAGIDKIGKKVSSVGKKMSIGLTLPIVAFGVAGVRASGNFEAAMNRMGVVAKKVGDKTIADLETRARSLGETTQFTASQAANAMEELSKAGQNTSQVFESAVGTLNLAGAGTIEMAQAAKIASKAMTIFGLKAAQTTDVADVLTRAFTAAPTTIEEVGTALVFGGGAAKAMGLSLKDTGAILAAFAKQGEIGTLGGTKLRKVMNSLADPTAEAIGAFNKLGIGFSQVFDRAADGQPVFKGMINLVKQFEKSNLGLAEASQIFGQRAGPLMFNLVKKGSKDLIGLRAAMDNVGITAKKVSEANLKGFNGQMKKLVSAFEAFQIAMLMDTGLLAMLTKAFEKVTNGLRRLAKMNPAFLKLIFIVGAVIAAVGPLLFIVGGLMIAFAKIGAVVAAAGGIFALLFNPVTLVIAGILALITVLKMAGFGWMDMLRISLRFIGGFSLPFIAAIEFIIENWKRLLPFFKLLFLGLGFLFKKFVGIVKPILNVLLAPINLIINGIKKILSFGLGILEKFASKLLPEDIKAQIGFEDPKRGTSGADFVSNVSQFVRGDQGAGPGNVGSQVLVRFQNPPAGTTIEKEKGDLDIETERGQLLPALGN